MSKAVIYENTDKLVISTPFNGEFVQFLKNNVLKKDKEWNSRMKTWTITNTAKEVVLAKVTEMFEIEEFEFDFNVSIAKDELTAKVTDEVVFTKDISPAPAPKNEESKKVEKIETIKEEKKEITEAKAEENQDSEVEEIELRVEIDLRNCETREDVADAFKLATGNDFDMKFDEDLNDCKNLSNAVIFYSKNYISVDDKNGNECYYNEICDSVKDSIDLYYYNAIKKEIEENKKIIKTRYWGEQYQYPIINETVDYKIMEGFENSRAYKCILQRAMNAADVETESWVMIDIEKFKDYTFDNETKLLYVETYTEGEFQHKGSSLSEETNIYQRLSPIFYRNEFQENFDIYKRDEDGNFTEERIEYDFLSFQITNYLKNKNYDSDTVYFLFCDENGDELNEERKSVFEDKELKIPENCKILQILGKTNALIRD